MHTVYLVRHGQTEWNSTGKYRGRFDIPLSDEGREQARRTGRELHTELGADGSTPIFTSPLSRSAETAVIIAKHLESSVSTVDDLTDVDFGSWQGKTREEIKNEYVDSYNLYHNRPELVLFPEGESLVDCAARTFRVFGHLVRHRGEERGVIVTHRVVLKLVILFAIGLNVSHFWNVKLDTCSISTIEFDGMKYTLSGLNRNAHLRGDAGPAKSPRTDF